MRISAIRLWPSALGSSCLVLKLFLGLEKRARELRRIKRLEILSLLAEADEFNWNAKIFLNRHNHPALACAIEFRDHEPGELYSFIELARLVESIHSRSRIEHEQRLMGRARNFLVHNAMQLLQFLHQIVLGMQPASSVNKQIVSLP